MRIFLDSFFIVLFLTFIGVSIYYWKSKVWGKRIGVVAFTWFFLITFSPLPEYLLKKLEHSYRPFNNKDINQNQLVYIVVLGGGVTEDVTLPDRLRLSYPSLGRFLEAINIYNMVDNGKLIFSGHTPEGKISQAEIMATMATNLGVISSDTLWLPQSTNTRTEAINIKKRMGKNVNLILVTDASHMPRAMAWFHQEGLNPIPAPTNFLVKVNKDDYSFSFKPSNKKIGMTNRLIHEYLGMLWLNISTQYNIIKNE